jgi:hypothetical protein
MLEVLKKLDEVMTTTFPLGVLEAYECIVFSCHVLLVKRIVSGLWETLRRTLA